MLPDEYEMHWEPVVVRRSTRKDESQSIESKQLHNAPLAEQYVPVECMHTMLECFIDPTTAHR